MTITKFSRSLFNHSELESRNNIMLFVQNIQILLITVIDCNTNTKIMDIKNK